MISTTPICHADDNGAQCGRVACRTIHGKPYCSRHEYAAFMGPVMAVATTREVASTTYGKPSSFSVIDYGAATCTHEWHVDADGLPGCHDGMEGRRCEGMTVQCGRGSAVCLRHGDRLAGWQADAYGDAYASWVMLSNYCGTCGNSGIDWHGAACDCGRRPNRPVSL